ncbi:MAG TPA: hypothetical protein VFS47_17860 [Steroidobacteraceae bacterium]|nr:hypothetical protein [Steroidobacteraceae bacterium]
MVLAALTPEEQRRHEKAMAKLRAELFRKYSPAQYFIVAGSEGVTPASAEMCWMEGVGSYRKLCLGGLRYRIDCADEYGLAALHVRHRKDKEFCFWIESAQDFTVVSRCVQFTELSTCVRPAVLAHLAENWCTVICKRHGEMNSNDAALRKNDGTLRARDGTATAKSGVATSVSDESPR